jgi:hypothetical protein
MKSGVRERGGCSVVNVSISQAEEGNEARDTQELDSKETRIMASSEKIKSAQKHKDTSLSEEEHKSSHMSAA